MTDRTDGDGQKSFDHRMARTCGDSYRGLCLWDEKQLLARYRTVYRGHAPQAAFGGAGIPSYLRRARGSRDESQRRARHCATARQHAPTRHRATTRTHVASAAAKTIRSHSKQANLNQITRHAPCGLLRQAQQGQKTVAETGDTGLKATGSSAVKTRQMSSSTILRSSGMAIGLCAKGIASASISHKGHNEHKPRTS